jgi:uncharacterized OB-fold protein
MSRPLPQPSTLTQAYWDAARERRLVIQRCSDCGVKQFYPRPFCLACLSEAVEWVDASGRGTIYTFTINHRAAYAGAPVPQAVAIVQLEEGPRLMANIIDSPFENITIGAPVEVCFEEVSADIVLPQFRLRVAS